MANALLHDPVPVTGCDGCHLRIPSDPEWIESTVDYLVRRATKSGAVAATRGNRLMMALHEALTNAVIHGNLGVSSALKDQGPDVFARAVSERCADPFYSRRVVDVRAHFDGEAARWAFTDEGDGFDYEAVLHRLDTEGPDLDKPSGRGLVMIRAFMDEMRYEQGGRRLVVAMRQPVEERRDQQRVPLVRGVHVAPIDPHGRIDFAASQEAVTRDISAGGIGLLQTHLVNQARVLISIPTANGSVSVPAEVRHWQALADGAVEVGCRFEVPLPGATGEPTALEALDRLIEELAIVPIAPDERREAQRVPYTERIGIALPHGGQAVGFGRDLSRSGIAFFSTVELPLGEALVSLPSARCPRALCLRAHVLRCTRLVDGFYDVGARFLGG